MSLDDIESILTKKIAQARHIKATVLLDFGEDGVLHIDSTVDPAVISHTAHDSDATLICSADTFRGILAGTHDPNFAYMTGKLKIRGSMRLAMQLNSALED